MNNGSLDEAAKRHGGSPGFQVVSICSRDVWDFIHQVWSPPDTHIEKPPLDYPHLEKLIVIPRACNTANTNTINIPLDRAYVGVCAEYGISQEVFLDFLDELNLLAGGHRGIMYMQKAGKAVHFAGHLDPTRFTALVGQCINLTAHLVHLAYIKGPWARRTPKHLQASILSGKQLRKLLGLDPKFPLCAPLNSGWTVPSKNDLMRGVRSWVRVPARQIYQLLEYVYDMHIASEANENWKEEKGWVRRHAARMVRNWQVVSEIQHEIWRGEALRLYDQAREAQDLKMKNKLAKKADKKDMEMKHTEKITWLVIQNWSPPPG
ncbi:hypothetical protein BO71DRAFT_440160 [Aspergillus ellipticus CBS 707.79]|uniref:Uncharacterized protein n=1 Tax=Aspergillus ellipticus CBS 707.79 TaxID=1448320 RepID=A0A319DE12_9EURO|nr:hypothetical protein BO71DRAFT_440160 [Aspergillus ellipticus CBS 707.79]